MEGHVNTFHVRQRDLLPQDHLVERADEEGVQETTMKDGQANNSADELEEQQMLRVDAGVRIDLKGVIVMCRVLEQTIEWIEHLMREEEEELPAGCQ